MADDEDKWERPSSPPPNLFLGDKERNIVKQINDELVESVIGQQVLYFPVDIVNTNYHPIYGEAIQKTFLNPIRCYALVLWKGLETTWEPSLGIDKRTRIEVRFQKKRIGDDQNVFVTEGDYVRYGTQFFEIVSVSQPRELFGQAAHRFEIIASCLKARQGEFDAE